ncbi:SMI1/KNR4 family protein [Paenibacillus sp. YYML68]|uniref:SMI1/KNR4 family protein n=1 Tax=Paenibacillus sp. YYML68 TaxID=2909250 RepID=UPI0037C6F3C4
MYIQNKNGEIDTYSCTFHPPASKSDIERLESEIGINIPLDYRNFLETCNGCSLFDHTLYGGENITSVALMFSESS